MEGIRISRNSDRTEIRLLGRLSVSDTPGLRRELETVLGGARPVEVDGTELAALDTAVLQLLTAFCSAVRARRLEIRWIGTSAALRQGAELLGLGAALGFDEHDDVTRH